MFLVGFLDRRVEALELKLELEHKVELKLGLSQELERAPIRGRGGSGVCGFITVDRFGVGLSSSSSTVASSRLDLFRVEFLGWIWTWGPRFRVPSRFQKQLGAIVICSSRSLLLLCRCWLLRGGSQSLLFGLWTRFPYLQQSHTSPASFQGHSTSIIAYILLSCS